MSVCQCVYASVYMVQYVGQCVYVVQWVYGQYVGLRVSGCVWVCLSLSMCECVVSVSKCMCISVGQCMCQGVSVCVCGCQLGCVCVSVYVLV